MLRWGLRWASWRAGSVALADARRRDRSGLATRLQLSRAWVWPTGIALAAVLVCLPFLRSVFGLADEGILLHGAARMARGQVLYRDLFELYPPLGFFIVRLWTLVAGDSFVAARLLVVAAIAGIAVFTAMACVRAGAGRGLATALTLAWLVMSQGAWTIVDHHWFTTLALMGALWAALDLRRGARDRSPLLAGLAIGAAVMITPPRGALAGLALAPGLWAGAGRVRRLALFVAGGAILPLLCLGWLVSQGALAAAVEDLVVFPATQYSGIQSVSWGRFAGPQDRLMALVFPAALLLAAVEAWRVRRTLLADRRLCRAGLFAVAGFIGCFPRPDIVHIGFGLPLALPLLALCAQRLGRRLSRRTRLWSCALAAAACAPAVVAYGMTAAAVATAPTAPAWGVSLPLGATGEPEIAADLAALPRDARIFYYPYIPLTPALAGRVGVTPFDVYMPGYTTAAQYARACRDLMRDAQWVVVDAPGTNPRLMKLIFPALSGVRPPEERAFEIALDRGFPRVRQRGRFTLRRRGPAASDTLCAVASGALPRGR